MVLYSMTEQQLEALVQKYADGIASPDEVKQLMDWYHDATLEAVTWPATVEGEKDHVYWRILHRIQDHMSVKGGRLFWLTPLRAAAVLLIIVGATTLFYLWPPTPVTYSTITNPSGQTRQVQLPDGSKVWLNAATTLRFANTFKEYRQLQLDGEAYFDVSHDSNHPFTVETGGIRITVLGTRFNVSSYGSANRTTVSLLQGKVQVANAEKELAVLKPDTQLEWEKSTGKATIKPIDTTAVVAWKAGRLVFHGQPLNEIVQTLERWYGIHIRIDNASAGKCRYYMNFDSAMPLKDLLPLLSEVTKMDYSFDKRTIVISGNGCQ
jgi:transmembrane sensor